MCFCQKIRLLYKACLFGKGLRIFSPTKEDSKLISRVWKTFWFGAAKFPQHLLSLFKRPKLNCCSCQYKNMISLSGSGSAHFGFHVFVPVCGVGPSEERTHHQSQRLQFEVCLSAALSGPVLSWKLPPIWGKSWTLLRGNHNYCQFLSC